jgi:Epoxide hydrolase N terminus
MIPWRRWLVAVIIAVLVVAAGAGCGHSSSAPDTRTPGQYLWEQPGHNTPEQLVRLQVHGRPRQPRVALVQERGTQQAQAADSPFQQLPHEWIGDRVPGQRVQVALDDGSGGFLGHGQGTGRTKRPQPIYYQLLYPPSPPRKSAGWEAGTSQPTFNPGDSPMAEAIKHDRRRFLCTAATAVAAAQLGTFRSAGAQPGEISAAVRPFRVNVPDEQLLDLRRRIAATRWPDRETVADQSQGVRLAKLQELVRYWGTDYDWRKAQAKLNALPQFMTKIDGLDIHFIHVRSRHPDALPLIITHGWPGSVLELLKVIGPLTNPTAHRGRAEDAFDVVVPSMPGYGFSGKPTGTGWNPEHIARTWAVLMERLGYNRYVSQGGDWGSVISDVMARQAPAGLIGIHANMPATVVPEVAKALAAGDPAPDGLSDKEKAAFVQMSALYTRGAGYAGIMVTRPQTLG